MLRKYDILWVLACPAYLLIATIRHEGSHAIAGIMQGASVTQFVILPSFHEEMGFSWGYVCFSGPTTWWMSAAPYLCDLFTFGVFFAVAMRLSSWPRWLWLNIVIVGLVSPLADTFYNYVGRLRDPSNDFAWLLQDFPGFPVHCSFIVVNAAYILGLYAVFMYSKMARRSQEGT
jgi:hypothetical protein